MSRPLRVLLVEDSEDDAELLLRELRKAGYDPVSRRVDTAEATRSALFEEDWDIIISDHAMPQFSSLAALALYRERGLDIPFLIVSGAIGETAAVEAMQAGAHDYILKDNLARLTAAIERELHEAVERQERRRAEQELARAGIEWSETFDAMPSAVCLLGLDYRIIRANQALARLAGRTAEELVGENYCQLAFGQHQPPAVLPKEPDQPVDVVFERLAPGRTFEVTFHPIRDELGIPRALVQVARDVTEARRLQAQLVQSQKLAALGEVISGIAHELNNPLAAVVAHAQFLLQDELSGAAADDAKAVEESALRAARIVRNLLVFAHRQELQRTAVNLNQVVEETLALRAAQLMADGIEVVTELATDLPPVLGDPHQLQQVLLNLINNAERAMRAKSGVRRLTVSTQTDDDLMRVWVADTGIGIPSALLDRIFEPFFTTQNAGKGTGLGLSVCHGIVRGHGGSISVSSRPGEGSEFVVEFPALRDTPESEQTETPPTPSLVGSCALVVDDEMLIRIALVRMLRGLGLEVIEARSGDEALRALDGANCQLIISDLKMPGMTGQELHAQVHSRRPELARRFIFCTGDTMNPETQAFVDAVGARLLVKPFLASEVEAAVSAVLAG